MKLLFALAISALAVAIPAPSLEGGAANLLHQVASSDPLLARTALIASSPNLINQVTTQTVKATRFMATMEQVRSLISVVSSVVQRFRAPQAQAALAKDLHNPAVAQELEGLQAKAAQLTAQIHAHLDPMMEAASSAAVKSPKAAELASSMAGKIRFRSISPSVAAEASEAGAAEAAGAAESAGANIRAAQITDHPHILQSIQQHKDIISQLEEIEAKLVAARPVVQKASQDILKLAAESKTIIQILIQVFTDVKLLAAAFVGAGTVGGAIAVDKAVDRAMNATTATAVVASSAPTLVPVSIPSSPSSTPSTTTKPNSASKDLKI